MSKPSTARLLAADAAAHRYGKLHDCHRAENFKVGDIRGGISISVPISGLQEVSHTEILHTAIFYAVLWAAGVCGIVLTGRRLASQVRRVRQAEEELCRAYAGLETTVQRRTAELNKQIEKRREADDARCVTAKRATAGSS